jgi:hypothetical protein
MKFIGTHLEDDLYADFKELAQTEGRTIRGQMRYLSRAYLEARKPRKAATAPAKKETSNATASV